MEPQVALASEYVPAAAPRPPGRLRLVPGSERIQELTSDALAAVLRETSEACDVNQWWSELCLGELYFTKFLANEKHSLAVLHRRRGNDARKHALTERRRRVLETILDGRSLKYLALDLGCASSTVSAELKHVIASMGLGARVAELPLLVAQLRCAVRARSGIDARCATFRLGGEEHLILAMERVETQWLAQLSRAEAEVLALLLKGYSYAGIGASRDASSRTIANQVASIFRKFGVSGRLELLATIARGRAASHRFS